MYCKVCSVVIDDYTMLCEDCYDELYELKNTEDYLEIIYGNSSLAEHIRIIN